MKIKVQITGEKPILIQSDRLADPLDPIAREKTSLSKHRDKKTDEYQEKIGKLEWFGALYLDEEGRPQVAIPCDNIVRALRDAAAKFKLGETVRREIVVSPDLIPFEYDGPRDLEQLYADPRFRFRKTVAQGKVRVVRVRPRLPVWGLSFEISIAGAATLRPDEVRKFLEAAGMVGLGTWRPRYGHFSVQRFNVSQ